MSAADVAALLGYARREGRGWRCRCPLHGGHSLVLRDGHDGLLLLTCWAGCDRLDVLAELRRRGLVGGRADHAPRIVPAPCRSNDLLRSGRFCSAAADDGRPSRASLGCGQRGWKRNEAGHWLRVMPRPAGYRSTRLPAPRSVFRQIFSARSVQHIERGPLAVHCTYLRSDGSGKADVEKQKAIFGPVAGSAVHFGTPQTGQWLAVAEGIETAPSVAVACSMPVWAALSANGIKNLILPPEATDVVICADHDANGVGERAAYDAATRWIAERRRVRVAKLPRPDSDFNDILSGTGSVEINEACHGAA
jgi:putative DNA primase/helicase